MWSSSGTDVSLVVMYGVWRVQYAREKYFRIRCLLAVRFLNILTGINETKVCNYHLIAV